MGRDEQHTPLAHRPSASRWLVASGMALFYAHTAAHMLFKGWGGGGWSVVHTLALVLVGGLALRALSRNVDTRALLRRAYCIGVTTGLAPLFVYVATYTIGDIAT